MLQREELRWHYILQWEQCEQADSRSNIFKIHGKRSYQPRIRHPAKILFSKVKLK